MYPLKLLLTAMTLIFLANSQVTNLQHNEKDQLNAHKNLSKQALLQELVYGQINRNFLLDGKKKMSYQTISVSETPGPDKEKTEDAYYAGKYMIAVADGVGGWRNHGIDPSAFSKGLCVSAYKYFESNVTKYISDPRLLMIDSSKEVKHVGSSTLVIATIDPYSKILHTANLGDSGYLLYNYIPSENRFRQNFVSEEQQHSFNFPYQLAYKNGDSPQSANVMNHTLEDLDLLVVASDGLLDNLFPNDIEEILNEFLTKNSPKFDSHSLNQLAKILNQRAFDLAQDRDRAGPFSVRAREQGILFQGGKPDDITVVVAQINLIQNNSKKDEF